MMCCVDDTLEDIILDEKKKYTVCKNQQISSGTQIFKNIAIAR